MSTRLLVSLSVALVAFGYVYGSWLIWPGYSTDYDQLHWAAEALLRGDDPYAAIRAINTASGVAWGLLYPLPAVLVAVPFVLLPLPLARALVAAMGAGSLALLLTRERGKWPVLLSAAMRSSVSLVQLTPFIACAALSPWFGWALAVKPHSGMAVLGASAEKRKALIGVGGASLLTLLSFVLEPQWPLRWYAAVAASDYHAPLAFRPGGFLILLAALRWKRPEARWLLGIALLPSTPNVYDALPLFAVMSLTPREALILGILSHAADIGAYVLRADETFAALQHANALTLIWLLYIPVTLMVLRRANAATATHRLDQLDTARGAARARGVQCA